MDKKEGNNRILFHFFQPLYPDISFLDFNKLESWSKLSKIIHRSFSKFVNPAVGIKRIKEPSLCTVRASDFSENNIPPKLEDLMKPEKIFFNSLQDDEIPETAKEVFNEKGLSLSENTKWFKQGGKLWISVDGKKKYKIRKSEDKGLKIYEAEICKNNFVYPNVIHSTERQDGSINKYKYKGIQFYAYLSYSFCEIILFEEDVEKFLYEKSLKKLEESLQEWVMKSYLKFNEVDKDVRNKNILSYTYFLDDLSSHFWLLTSNQNIKKEKIKKIIPSNVFHSDDPIGKFNNKFIYTKEIYIRRDYPTFMDFFIICNKKNFINLRKHNNDFLKGIIMHSEFWAIREFINRIAGGLERDLGRFLTLTPNINKRDILKRVLSGKIPDKKINILDRVLQNFKDCRELCFYQGEKELKLPYGQDKLDQYLLTSKIGNYYDFLIEYLFDLSYPKYKEHLDEEGSIDEELIKAFDDKGYDVDDEAELYKENDVWTVVENGEDIFTIRREEDKLNIYQKNYGEEIITFYGEETLKELKGYEFVEELNQEKIPEKLEESLDDTALPEISSISVEQKDKKWKINNSKKYIEKINNGFEIKRRYLGFEYIKKVRKDLYDTAKSFFNEKEKEIDKIKKEYISRKNNEISIRSQELQIISIVLLFFSIIGSYLFSTFVYIGLAPSIILVIFLILMVILVVYWARR